MKKVFCLSAASLCSFIAFNVNAVELLVMEGQSRTMSCLAPQGILIESAHADVHSKLGSLVRYKHVSAWANDVKYVNWPNTDTCQFAFATAHASFVERGRDDEDRFVTTQGNFQNNKTQQVEEGVAWDNAVKNASNLAAFYCNGSAVVTHEGFSKSVEENTEFVNYSVSGRFKCTDK